MISENHKIYEAWINRSEVLRCVTKNEFTSFMKTAEKYGINDTFEAIIKFIKDEYKKGETRFPHEKCNCFWTDKNVDFCHDAACGSKFFMKLIEALNKL